ncbi:MAG TPA: SO_0444 family Cu/Zn efflux transporter [candidate division Zixibacteria bacterium]|jgi:hypothetical protein
MNWMLWIAQAAKETWHVALMMAPYIVLGLTAAIVVLVVFPSDRIHRLIGKPGFVSNLKAALAGIPLPLCSCGVLPTALTMKRRGASRGSVVSFLVSTPETGVDSIAVTYALINPLMTILRPAAALVSALTTGLAVDRFSGSQQSESGGDHIVRCIVCHEAECATGHGWPERVRSAARYVAFDFFPDIANWLAIGLVLSGVLAVWLPDQFFGATSAWGQMALVIIAGVPLYICASASTPIAAVLLAKGMMPGAVLVFLLVGPATNVAALAVIARELGRRTTAVYITALIVISVLIGWIVNAGFGAWDWTPNVDTALSEESATVLNWLGVIVLIAAFLATWLRRLVRVRRHSTATA